MQTTQLLVLLKSFSTHPGLGLPLVPCHLIGVVQNMGFTVGQKVIGVASCNSFQVAISTVLNHPHKRQAPPKAHSALPAAVPVDLPRVRRKDFDSYLRAVAPEWSRFESTSRPGRDSAAHLGGIAYRNGLMPLDTPQTPSWPICAGRSLPPLDSVPSVFFKYDFNLANPDTFDAVTERNSDSEVSADPSSLSHSLPLLEKFSHYADAVEQHLVQEVSLRSTSFFAALTNLRELQSESEQCLARIGTLRTLLKDIDEKTAKRGLEIVRKETRLRNLGIVRDGMKAINGWVEMTSVAKTLASAGQWSEALGVVDALEMHWSGKPTPAAQPVEPASDFRVGNGPFGLSPTVESDTASPKPRLELQSSSLRAFAALPTHLRDLIAEIAASLTSEVVSVLRLDLVARIDAPPGVPRDENPNLLLKDRLRPLLIGLVRTKGLDGAMLSWREVVMEEVRAVMKRVSFDVLQLLRKRLNLGS
jgi:vacuolar protein sorting-associated protein 54